VQAHALVDGLCAEGCDARLLPTDPGPPAALAWLRRVPYARSIANEASFLPGLAATRGADAVVVFAAAYWSFLLGPAPAIAAARAAGARTVLAYHSGEAPDHLRRWGRRVHPWLRMADAIVVPSWFLGSVFARYGYAPHRIPNVVDTARFRFRERARLAPRLVSARNLEAHYRVDDTLRAFVAIRGRFPEATLTVIGDGSEAEALRRLAARIGTRGITFAGPVAPEIMPLVYHDAEIFINASVVDNQPVSVLEAFASGLPVVSTAAGGLEELVRDGVTGIVVPPRDPDAIARAVIRLVESPPQADQIARNARAAVAAYTWPEVRRSWLALLAGEAP